jgi:hypothetical protein
MSSIRLLLKIGNYLGEKPSKRLFSESAACDFFAVSTQLELNAAARQLRVSKPEKLTCESSPKLLRAHV